MTPFKTNQLKYSLDRNALAEIYDIFQVSTDEKKIKYGSNCLDLPLMEKKVVSVRFESGNSFFVLMEKSKENRSLLLNCIKQADDASKLYLPQISFSDVDDRTILQLLLNSLGNAKNPILRINNLTGHLYCYNADWLTKGKDDSIEQVSCLEISISKEMRLTFPVHTFTSIKLKDEIYFSKKKPFESYPRFVFSKFHTLARKTKESKGEEYIQRPQKFHKSDIEFLNLKDASKFEASKMGVVADIILRFNEKFNGLAHLDFENISKYKTLDHAVAQTKEEEIVKRAFLSNKKLRIIDFVKDSKSKKLCEGIIPILETLSGIKPVVGVNKIKDGLNIVLIHKKDWYKNEVDPHSEYKDVSTQHITVDGVFKSKKANIRSVINELIIKDDIKNHKFSLYNWSKLEYGEKISFAMRVYDADEKEHIVFMTVLPDGTFKFEQKDPTDIFDFNDYTRCMSVFSSSKDTYGIVMNAAGQMNTIKNTQWFTIPEIFKIRDELKLDQVHAVRNKTARDELMSGILDIKMFEQDGGTYYFVGTIGDGMKVNVANAVNIRKIEPVDNAPMFFEQLLPLMNTVFVNNQRLTVVPFPFKYLREWATLNSLSIL